MTRPPKPHRPDLTPGEDADVGLGRRRHVRHGVTRFAWYHTIGLVEPFAIEGLSYSVDISRGGAGLVVSHAVPIGTLMMLLVVFHSKHYNLAAVCRVVHSREQADGSYRLGLQYEVLPPDARQFLMDNFA